jgi:uracil phosphoribosyltransferase
MQESRHNGGAGMEVLKRINVPVDANVYKVSHPQLPRNTYILCMSSARKILYDPVVCGERLRRLAIECNKTFLKTAWQLVPNLKKTRANDICEVVVLRGGLAYALDVAFEDLFDAFLPRCVIGARRYRISGEKFGAEIKYINFDPLPDNGILLMGDTIATGASLSRTLAEVRDELRRRDYRVKKLLVFSIAAAFKGSTRLFEWEERFREWWPNFRIHFFAAEALFGLVDGTHLRFRKEGEAIVPEEVKKYVSKVYGDYERGFLPNNICAIFDWGDRSFRIERHLKDVLRFASSSLKATKDPKAKRILKRIQRDAKLELKKLGWPLKRVR